MGFIAEGAQGSVTSCPEVVKLNQYIKYVPRALKMKIEANGNSSNAFQIETKSCHVEFHTSGNPNPNVSSTQ
ncbi:hypothetical protein STEG23_025856 [Scotinomys teguina]